MTRTVTAILIGAMALLAFRCGGGPGPESAGKDDTGPDSSDLVVTPTDEQLSRAGAASAEPYPAEVLADKRITFAEYEGAVLEMVKCAEQGRARLTTGTPRLDASTSYALSFVWDASDFPQASKAVDDCGRMCLYPIQELWTFSRSSVIPESTVASATEVFWECIEDAGIDIEDRPRHVSTTG